MARFAGHAVAGLIAFRADPGAAISAKAAFPFMTIDDTPPRGAGPLKSIAASSGCLLAIPFVLVPFIVTWLLVTKADWSATYALPVGGLVGMGAQILIANLVALGGRLFGWRP